MNLKELWNIVKSRAGFGVALPTCVVCGDDLEGQEEIGRKHCPNCWPAYLRRGYLQGKYLRNTPVRPMGKATGRR